MALILSANLVDIFGPIQESRSPRPKKKRKQPIVSTCLGDLQLFKLENSNINIGRVMSRLVSLPAELQIKILQNFLILEESKGTLRNIIAYQQKATKQLLKPWLRCHWKLKLQVEEVWWKRNTFVVRCQRRPIAQSHGVTLDKHHVSQDTHEDDFPILFPPLKFRSLLRKLVILFEEGSPDYAKNAVRHLQKLSSSTIGVLYKL